MGDSTESSVASKSSPFHGFSSQDEADNEKMDQEEEDFVQEGGEIELKSQILADFEIGNEASEEEMTISDSDMEKDMKKEVKAPPMEEYVEQTENEEKKDQKEEWTK